MRTPFGLLVAPFLVAQCGGGATGAHEDASANVAKDSSAPHDARVDRMVPRADARPDASSDAQRLDGSPDASSDAPSAPCGSRQGMRGLTTRSIEVDGKLRTYLVYLPATADPTTPMPFVFVFHGYTMSGRGMYDITQYAALADAEGIGIAFPDGEGGPGALSPPWNVENTGQTVCGAGQFAVAAGDDFAFIDAMKADVGIDQCLDAKHLFSTGFSMGGYFTHHIGCYRSDMRAVAPHSGGTTASLSGCTTGHVPIIIFHGTADSVIADDCDDPQVLSTLDPGFPASATLWAAKNGCQPTYATVPTDSDAGGAAQCYVYDGCPADGQVELCTFSAMNHCWAGGSKGGDAGQGAFACPTYASATLLEWAFFKKYAW